MAAAVLVGHAVGRAAGAKHAGLAAMLLGVMISAILTLAREIRAFWDRRFLFWT